MCKLGMMVFAHVAVFAIYLSTAIAVHGAEILRTIFRRKTQTRAFGELRVLLVGTFYNENWFRSHILPLSACQSVRHIHVVTDSPLFEVGKVTYHCPPRWLRLPFGRMTARTIMMLLTAWRYRPDWMMGYHIMPNALLCLVFAKLFGCRSIYQMTGGPIQVIGGGTGSENTLLRRLQRPSVVCEALLFHDLRSFDAIAVRGEQARQFVEQHRLSDRTLVITGSVDVDQVHPSDGPKKYDLVNVSRLVPQKGLEFFIDVVSAFVRKGCSVQAAIVGGGPLMDSLKSRAVERGASDAFEFLGRRTDVPDILASSRVFVLTSPSEGMSIAMLEAMAAGLPVVVTDVGDLRDVVRDGLNGRFLNGHDVDADAALLDQCLRDTDWLSRAGRAARETAVNTFSVSAIAGKWDHFFGTASNGSAGTH